MFEIYFSNILVAALGGVFFTMLSADLAVDLLGKSPLSLPLLSRSWVLSVRANPGPAYPLQIWFVRAFDVVSCGFIIVLPVYIWASGHFPDLAMRVIWAVALGLEIVWTIYLIASSRRAARKRNDGLHRSHHHNRGTGRH